MAYATLGNGNVHCTLCNVSFACSQRGHERQNPANHPAAGAIGEGRDWLREEARRVAEEAWRRASRDLVGNSCHLYYRAGELKMWPNEEDDDPAGFELAWGVAIPVGAMTIDQITARVIELAQRVACLPPS